jgi:hypothetical protein
MSIEKMSAGKRPQKRILTHSISHLLVFSPSHF